MKLLESNVFSFVCLSICSSGRGRVPCDHYTWSIGPHHTGTPDMGPHCTGTRPAPPQPCPLRYGTLLYKDYPRTYPCFFKTWTSLYRPPPPDMFKFIHYAPRTVGKRAVRILLECFLVIHVIEQRLSKVCSIIDIWWIVLYGRLVQEVFMTTA